MSDIEEMQKILFQHGFDSCEPLSSGSYSSVFLCHSTKYNEIFAIKRVVKNTITQLEYNALVSLNHPHIIKLYEAFEHGDYQYLIMEYCSNGNLKQKGKLDKEEFLSYSKQILQALAVCHSKLIAHRDIKPENIFLDKYNRIKLADFGFARQFNDNSLSNEKCGSMMYSAPEIFKSQSVDPFLTDIWSLGATFFYMATGNFPFLNRSIEELKHNVMKGQINYDLIEDDQRIRSLIMKMTSITPRNRPSAESLLRLPMYSSKPIFLSKSISSYSTLRSGYNNVKVKTHSPEFSKSSNEKSNHQQSNQQIPQQQDPHQSELHQKQIIQQPPSQKLMKSTQQNVKSLNDHENQIYIQVKKVHAYRSVICIPHLYKNRLTFQNK